MNTSSANCFHRREGQQQDAFTKLLIVAHLLEGEELENWVITTETLNERQRMLLRDFLERF